MDDPRQPRDRLFKPKIPATASIELTVRADCRELGVPSGTTLHTLPDSARRAVSCQAAKVRSASNDWDAVDPGTGVLDAICAHPLRGSAAGYRLSTSPSSPATTSPTTRARASSTPRPVTAARTSNSGWRARACSRRGTSIRASPTPSTRTALSRAKPQASKESGSSMTRARRAMRTRRSSKP